MSGDEPIQNPREEIDPERIQAKHNRGQQVASVLFQDEGERRGEVLSRICNRIKRKEIANRECSSEDELTETPQRVKLRKPPATRHDLQSHIEATGFGMHYVRAIHDVIVRKQLETVEGVNVTRRSNIFESIAPAAAVEKSSVRLIDEFTATGVTCPNCDRDNLIPCQNCSDGVVSCPNAKCKNGTLKEDCSCRNGNLPKESSLDNGRTCPDCYGDTEITIGACPTCTDAQPLDQAGKINCPECGGDPQTNRATCPNCDGQGAYDRVTYTEYEYERRALNFYSERSPATTAGWEATSKSETDRIPPASHVFQPADAEVVTNSIVNYQHPYPYIVVIFEVLGYEGRADFHFDMTEEGHPLILDDVWYHQWMVSRDDAPAFDCPPMWHRDSPIGIKEHAEYDYYFDSLFDGQPDDSAEEQTDDSSGFLSRLW